MTVWYDERNGAVVVQMPLPADACEAVTPNDDGTYTVVINAQKSAETRLRAYRHALHHIAAGDFESAAPVQMIEARAEGVA